LILRRKPAAERALARAHGWYRRLFEGSVDTMRVDMCYLELTPGASAGANAADGPAEPGRVSADRGKTPQVAAAEVAEPAGSLAVQLRQRVAGVVENMSHLPCPHCGERVDVFGTGGGEAVARALTRAVGAGVPVLGQVPIDLRLREAGQRDPCRAVRPGSPAAQQLTKIAQILAAPSGGTGAAATSAA
jgi:NUBPL iron-transfer P-loop NTPase